MRLIAKGGEKTFSFSTVVVVEVVGLSLCGSCVAPRGSRDTSCQGDRLAFRLAALFMLG